MYRHDNDALSVMDWFCADTETEILTARGWRRYDQVATGDLVASLNTLDGVARWAPIQRMNIFELTGEKMLRIEGKALSALVTVGHRWPVQQRIGTPSGRRLAWQVRTSDQLTLESSVVRSAPFEHPEHASHADALVELVGWAWTEGSYRENGGIHLSQSPSVNPQKCERITQALTALYGPPMGRAGRTAGCQAWNVADYAGTRYWRLNVAAAAPVLAAAPDHVLDPAWLLTLTAEQLNLLVETSMLADGHTRVRDGARDSALSQNRQDRAEAFQFAAILAGRATSIHRWEMQHKGAAYPMWRVSLLERVTAKPLRQAVAEWTIYTGVVWCPTVEYGTWLCRRNGLVHWTGNCGAGGSSQGVHAVPGVRVTRAANHWERAIASHAANFPETDHYQGDIRQAPVWDWPVTDIFWASPECTNWSVAKGKQRDFDKTMQYDLFSLLEEKDDEEPTAEEESRALMEEVPLYLRGVAERGGLVKAGIVENVVDVRNWDQWDRWLGEIRKLGYETRIIALNAMHAHPRTVHQAPQSRDRLFVAYWHQSLGRTPDWNKWLRPRAWCEKCGRHVDAMQVFKKQGRDMGRYRQQYIYRCPNSTCRYQLLEPETLPAAACIDWTLSGQRIGDRARPLADKTLARIQAGITRFARPVDGRRLQIPPLMVPVEGRDGKEANTALAPLRTQTARNETGLAWLPFIAELRGGGSVARPVTEALATVTASGNHHGLVTPDPRIAIVEGDVDIDDVLFRMLEPHEIGRAMSFADEYIVLGSKRERVKQYGNAVPPNMAEVLVCALVEAVTGESIDRHVAPALGVAA